MNNNNNNRLRQHPLQEWSNMRNSSLLESSLEVKEQSENGKTALIWAIISIFALIYIVLDLKDECASRAIVPLILEYLLVCVFILILLSCLVQLVSYCLAKSRRNKNAQKRLLNVTDADSAFLINSSPLMNYSSKNSNSGFKDSVLNWSLSMHSALHSHSYGTRKPQGSFNKTHQRKHLNSTFSSIFNSTGARSSAEDSFDSSYINYYEENVTDAEGLRKYLKKVAEKRAADEEEELLTLSTMYQSKNSFWNYNQGVNLLRNSVYQISPPDVNNSSHYKHGSREDLGFIDGNSEILKKVSSEKLSKYVSNLRVWLVGTILHRLVQEISNINEIFNNRGFHDMRIGNASLDRLKKTVGNHQFVSTYMPKLPLVLPFLNMIDNQEYLVQRIEDLAKGNYISEYRWDSGGSYHGQKWDKHLPTDAAILFHLFCVYMDSQLVPLPQGDYRPFYGRYVVLVDEKRMSKTILESVKNRANCAILCSSLMHPKFTFISEDNFHNSINNRHNLFYVILQFLTHIKAHNDSSLEGVNLGKSGINIMAVIEK